MNLADEYERLIGLLTAAGLSAAADPANITPPGVQLRPPTLTPRFGKGWDATWEAWIVAPDIGILPAARLFGPLIDQVQAALDWPVTQIRPEMTTWPDGALLPATVLTFTSKFFDKEATSADDHDD